MTRVPEPTVSYIGHWTMRDHRAEMFRAVYVRKLGRIWKNETNKPSYWKTILASDLRKVAGSRPRDFPRRPPEVRQ